MVVCGDIFWGWGGVEVVGRARKLSCSRLGVLLTQKLFTDRYEIGLAVGVVDSSSNSNSSGGVDLGCCFRNIPGFVPVVMCRSIWVEGASERDVVSPFMKSD